MKRILYIIFLTLLLLPLVGLWMPWLKERPLKGAYIKPEKPELTESSWFSGDFQKAYEPYLNDTLALHHTAVRLRNSLRFHLFHQTSAQNIVIGKQNYLFEQDYIDAYWGDDFVGNDTIQKKVRILQQLQEAFHRQGKTLLVCIAPSKADFYPEYLPEHHGERHSTNYAQYAKWLAQYRIPVIDFNRWYIAHKGKTPYPLFPPHGIHWSTYGSTLASDSLIRCLEQMRGERYNHLILDGYEIRNPEALIDETGQTIIESDDYDLGNTLNLFTRLKGYPMCYPKWHWTNNDTLSKPHLTVIADSFYWAIFNMGIQNSVFSGSFWYYNSSVYPESYNQETHVADLDLRKEMERTDILLIVITPPNLKDFGWGFLEAYQQNMRD